MALKNCPACQKQVGPRTKCDCGHEFAATDTSAVPASGQSMTLDPLDRRIADSVGAVKDILERVASRPATAEIIPPVNVPANDSRRTMIATPSCGVRHPSSWGKVFVPAGDCPVNPVGFKKGWPNGAASDEVIQNWAVAVFNYGGGRYAIDAVVYWAREFWDINSDEFRRVRDLILRALHTQQPDHEPTN